MVMQEIIINNNKELCVDVDGYCFYCFLPRPVILDSLPEGSLKGRAGSKEKR